MVQLRNDKGVWLEDMNCIDKIGEFYQGRFKSLGLREMMQSMVSMEDNEMLVRSIIYVEIEDVVFQLGADKAPGSNGFSALFYQFAWEDISNEVCGMVHEFFEGEVGLEGIDSTNIVLIPKVDNLESVNHFRPTGLCNMSI